MTEGYSLQKETELRGRGLLGGGWPLGAGLRREGWPWCAQDAPHLLLEVSQTKRPPGWDGAGQPGGCSLSNKVGAGGTALGASVHRACTDVNNGSSRRIIK